MQTWSKNRLAITAWQTAVLTDFGLTPADGQAQVWFVARNGRLFGGAEAINRALRLVWWAKPFTYLYPLPGIRQLQNYIYRWVAANRHRLPGATTTCQR